MIELEVYACGLRHNDHLLQLRSQMDMVPRVRYKIDANHDIVYFELDDPHDISQRQISRVFENIGLEPRFVGQVPPEIPIGSDTMRLE